MEKVLPFLGYLFLFGGGGNLGKFSLGGTSEIISAEFSHFLMTIVFDFLRPPRPKSFPKFCACGGLKTLGGRPPSPLGKNKCYLLSYCFFFRKGFIYLPLCDIHINPQSLNLHPQNLLRDQHPRKLLPQAENQVFFKGFGIVFEKEKTLNSTGNIFKKNPPLCFLGQEESVCSKIPLGTTIHIKITMLFCVFY